MSENNEIILYVGNNPNINIPSSIGKAENNKTYSTITEALKACEKYSDEQAVRIKLAPGTYKEQLTITKPYLTIEGCDPLTTIITYDLYANMIMDDGMKRGTFRSYSVLVDTHDFTAENITIENSAGPGTKVGQAIALYADGDRLSFINCRLLGSQDTLFTGPLPPKELKPNGFIGPKQFAPRINGRQYYKSCYIEGDVDFIFGSATAYFEDCEIFSINRDMETNGYVTAPSTAEGQEYGYVFEGCRFTSNCAPMTVYLGRPWRNFAKAVFLNCEMGNHIKKEGFHDWNKPESHETTFFGEYNSRGEGISDERTSFSHHLSYEEAKMFSRYNVLGF